MSASREPSPTAIEQHAADALIRRDAGWTDAEAAAFARWRAAAPAHEAAVQRAEATHRQLGRLRDFAGAADLLAEADELIAHASSRATPSAGRRRLRFVLPAAVALAACWTLALWVNAPSPPHRSDPAPGSATVSYSAPDQRRTVALADGSSLLLQRGSVTTVSFVPAERRIALQQGEAHFTVAHDTARPFIVSVDGVRIRAVGTAFNVERQPSGVEIVVTEGVVEVTREAPAAPTDAPLRLAHHQTAFIPLAPAAPLPAPAQLNEHDLRVRLAWQAPRLHFADTPLAEAVAQFNRYSPVQLTLADPSLGARAVGGEFDAANAVAFAQLLAASGDLRVETVAPDQILLSPVR